MFTCTVNRQVTLQTWVAEQSPKVSYVQRLDEVNGVSYKCITLKTPLCRGHEAKGGQHGAIHAKTFCMYPSIHMHCIDLISASCQRTCLSESELERALASESNPQKGCSGLYMPSASRYAASDLEGCWDSACLMWLAAALSVSMTSLTLHSGRAGTPFRGAAPGAVGMSCPLGMAF